MTIHVFGSLNLDLVCQTPRLPVSGETILGTHFATIPGGKGANQAVAAARLGAPTRMVGRVGADDFGQTLLDSLSAAGVDIQAVERDTSTHTGVASIAVDRQGNNHIIVVPGANGRVNPTDVQRLSAGFASGDLLLLQLEIPLEAVLAAAIAAQQAGVSVMLDPAPAQAALPSDLYRHVNILTPNQVEAEQLVGFAVNDDQNAVAAAAQLRQRGIQTVVIKRGVQGAYLDTASQRFHQPAFSVEVVDTVAAGDAFNGGLAVALSEGLALPQASQFAAATAALSVTQPGAQPSMPSRQAVEDFLKLPA